MENFLVELQKSCGVLCAVSANLLEMVAGEPCGVGTGFGLAGDRGGGFGHLDQFHKITHETVPRTLETMSVATHRLGMAVDDR